MNNLEEKLLELMEDGWNIQIECKANYRPYGMTYEVHAISAGKKKSLLRMTDVGESLEDVIDEILKK